MNLPSQEEFEKLQEDLKKMREELEANKRNLPIHQQVPTQEQFLNQFLEKAGEIFKVAVEKQAEVQEKQIEANKYIADRDNETDRIGFNTFDKVHKRDITTKTIIFICTITVLLILAISDKLSQGTIAIITLVLATVLRNDFADFFKSIYKRFGKGDDDDGDSNSPI